MISKNPLIEHVPLVRIGEGDVNTQYEMDDVERVGLLKMDFFGLRNLTVMKAASDEIRRTTDPAFDLATIPDDDVRTYEMLGRGETLGVFQLESEGMRASASSSSRRRLDRHHRARRALPARSDGLDSAVHHNKHGRDQADLPAPETRERS